MISHHGRNERSRTAFPPGAADPVPHAQGPRAPARGFVQPRRQPRHVALAQQPQQAGGLGRPGDEGSHAGQPAQPGLVVGIFVCGTNTLSHALCGRVVGNGKYQIHVTRMMGHCSADVRTTAWAAL